LNWVQTFLRVICGYGKSRLRRFVGITAIALIPLVLLTGVMGLEQYRRAGQRTQEAALKSQLETMRHAIWQFYSDTHVYPQSLDELVEANYLRRIPVDPMTSSAATWTSIQAGGVGQAGVQDVRSGATGKSRDRSSYSEW